MVRITQTQRRAVKAVASPAPSGNSVPAEYEKFEVEIKGVTFVYANRQGCSGKNLTPSQASDLLVGLMER